MTVRILVILNWEETRIWGNRGNMCGIQRIQVDLCLEYHSSDY